MMIESLTLRNYRCFLDFEVNFDNRLTVIVGSNGSGKTSILEGLAVSLGTMFTGLDGISGISIHHSDAYLKAYQMGESEDLQPQYPIEISVDGNMDGEPVFWTRSLNHKNGSTTIKDAKQMMDISRDYQSRLRAGDPTLVLPVIAYYGTGRLWDYHREKRTNTFKENTKINGYIDSLDGTANIKLMMNWFQKKTIQMLQKGTNNPNNSVELSVVYHAMKSCFERITGFCDIEFHFNVDTKEIECCYTDMDGYRMSMPLPQMSDGYKGTVSLVADIAYRMAVLNPQLGPEVLHKTDGVVLIDEVDLHLHPAWQHRILGDLLEIFPRVQFVVTTHAPAVISSVKSENLVILKNYDVLDTGTETYGKDVNSILEEIMGAPERNPLVAELFHNFYELLDQKKYDEAEHILDKIDEQRAYHDKEAVANRVKLKLERIRGGQR